MIDVPETQRHQRERSRVTARGKCIDDGSMTTLLVVNEFDGAWTFHGLGAPGVRLSQADTVALAESILQRARQREGG